MKKEIKIVDEKIFRDFRLMRVNTKSRYVADYTRAYLEAKFGLGFNLSVSSDKIIMLDIDMKTDRCLKEAKALCKALKEEYGGKCVIFETPRGYHIVLLKRLNHFIWRSFYESLLASIQRNKIVCVDEMHVRLALERDYATLRLNQLRVLEVI